MTRDPDELDDRRQTLVDAVDERALVLALTAIPPDHRLAVAARLALELGANAHERRRELKRWSAELSATGLGAELAGHLPLTLRREQERAERRQRRDVA